MEGAVTGFPRGWAGDINAYVANLNRKMRKNLNLRMSQPPNERDQSFIF